MKIGVFYSGRRLPVTGYGGTERVVVALVRGLVEFGHEVTLIAPEGSRLRECHVVPFAASTLARNGLDIRPLLPPGLDIVHGFSLLPPHQDLPYLWTMEGNRGPDKPAAPPTTIYVSADHAARHGSTAFVYNGLDPADLQFRATKDDYDLFLGRLHSSKGYQWAIAGAKLAERKLVVAGGWRPSLSRFVKFVGTVDGAEKATLLAGARLMWMPALWDEPFGLTLIEALWSGTPVLGTRRGSLVEVLAPDVAGQGDTLEELIALLPTMAAKDPAACRARAERWFSHLTLAEGYVRMYRAFLATGVLPAGVRAESEV